MKKILIVDDEPHVARVIRLYLQNAGYEVTYLSNSMKALQEFDALQPDLLITDVKMPQLNGLDLVKSIRETDSGRSIPVIMMTSCLSQKYLDWAESTDNLYFVSKPVSPRELIKIINNDIDGAQDSVRAACR